ncbi:MAG: CYTH domain-containing protein [Candidatus Paceibacterota bacterium]
MTKAQYEVEIKTLLGSEEVAEAFRAKLIENGSATVKQTAYTQLNHYFKDGNPQKLAEILAQKLDGGDAEQLHTIAAGQNISVRTREMDGQAYIVMKASIGSDSSQNGVMRAEIEAPVPGLTLDALDAEVLSAGYEYQAKWSRTREEYALGPVTVCLDRNAGYGYLAEFELVIEDSSAAEETKSELLSVMGEMGLAELAQDRLERMFAYYNEHWPEYYGTDRIFTIQ